MIKTYARKICHIITAISFLILLGLAGGIERGATLAEARPVTIAFMIITVLSVFAADLFGEEENA